MAIELEQKQKEKEKRPFTLPLWCVGIIIFILVIGVISYFLFIQETPKIELKDKKEGLSKEELGKIKTIEDELNISPIKDLAVIVPVVVISPSPVPEKIGRINPFSP